MSEDAAGALRALAGIMGSAEAGSTLEVKHHDLASLIGCIAAIVEEQQRMLEEHGSAAFKADCLAENNPPPDSMAAIVQRRHARSKAG